MLPFDDNIIKVISEAYEVGFNIPPKYLPSDVDKIPEGREVYVNKPLSIVRPDGVEFTYILFWNGRKFKGGYVSINNNYSGVQRGSFERNGETLFASHVYGLKKILS